MWGEFFVRQYKNFEGIFSWAVLKGIGTKANDFEQIKNKVIKPCNCKFFECVLLFFSRFLCTGSVLSIYIRTAFSCFRRLLCYVAKNALACTP